MTKTKPLILADHLLPSSFQDILYFQATLDKVYCFISKRKMRSFISTIGKIFNSSKSSLDETVSNTDGSSFSWRKLVQLCSICPKEFQIRYADDMFSFQPIGDRPSELELIFPNCANASNAHAKLRKKILLEAMSWITMQHYCTHNNIEYDETVATRIKKSGWPADFNVNLVPLPKVQEDWHQMVQSYCQHLNIFLDISNEINSNNPSADDKNQTLKFSMEESKTSDTIATVEQTSTDENKTSMNNVSVIESVIDHLKSLPFYSNQVQHVEFYERKEAIFLKLDESNQTLPARLKQRLSEVLGVSSFYRHQALAIGAVRRGENVVVSTSTASGKSVIYNVPIMEAIMEDSSITALYLFPTKALAQDQLRSIELLTGQSVNGGPSGLGLPVGAAVCDGDTCQAMRIKIQQQNSLLNNNIILTNPDMLHCTMLPEHRAWSRIFQNLRYVVIDESHQYRGSFGAHVSAVMRRLIRVCLLHGGKPPQFIALSATIANPADHFSKLIPVKVMGGSLTVIGSDLDGSPQGERHFVIWNPPMKWNQMKSNNLNERKLLDDISLSNPTIQNDKSSYSERTTKFHDQLKPTHERTISEDSNVSFDVQTTISNTKIASSITEDPATEFFKSMENSRPATLGPDTAELQQLGEQGIIEERKYGVSYVGGWKRKNREKKTDKQESVEIIAKPTKKRKNLVKSKEKQEVDFGRVSTIFETAQLFCALIRKELRTLAFCSVRKLVEMVLGYSLRLLEQSGNGQLAPRVASYRGGYTKEERRQIEGDLFSGKLLGVTATCALELGIDVGSLDSTLHMGFPGSISSLWQQAGRAGRSGRAALSIMICFDCPLDQYFARNPTALLQAPPEGAALNENNMHVLRSHLHCAAKEVPLNTCFSHSDITDAKLWGKNYWEVLEDLVSSNMLLPSQHFQSSLSVRNRLGGTWRYVPLSEQQSIGLRMIDPITISIMDEPKCQVIDSLGYSRAFFELYEGAIYLHRAQQFLVHRLDLGAAVAYTRPVKVPYYTSAKNNTVVNLLHQLYADSCLNCGLVQVVSVVYGFMKRWLSTGEPFEHGECRIPPLEYETTAFWIDLPSTLKQTLEEEGHHPSACVHGANHLLVSLCPLHCNCDSSDVATEHPVAGTTSGTPSMSEQQLRVMVFDRRSGGLGVSETLFERRREVLRQGLDLLQRCDCKFGCPSCLFDSRCSNYNGNLDKRGTERLLSLLLDHLAQENSTVDGVSKEVTKSSAAGNTTPPRSNSCAENLNKNTNNTTTEKASTEEDEFISPRKKARKKALKRAAMSRISERAHKMAVQIQWTEAVPDFLQESSNFDKNR